jgi:hypothetical protein
MEPIDPTKNAPCTVHVIRELGKGRAATARLVEATFADGSSLRCVEKVFNPGWLTRTIYRLSFFAPFAYQFNRSAIMACFFRRRVAAEVLRRRAVDVGVAAPLYVRFDPNAPGWVLAAEHVDGRGVRPASRGEIHPEIDQLVAVMRQARDALVDAGLTGSGWQIDPRAMVSTANLLRRNDRYTIVDLESGIPAILVPKYLLLAARTGSLIPFDDLDARILKAEIPDDADVAALVHHAARWKDSEPAPFRIGTWRHMYGRIRRRIERASRAAWRLVTQPRYQTYVGLKFIRRSIRRWENAERISRVEANQLSSQIDSVEVSAYARGMALHLAIKSLSPLMVPAKFGGAAATLATGNAWFLLPWLVLPLARTLVTLMNWLAAGRSVRHTEAFCVGLIPTLGSLAFPIQMFARRPALAAFLIRDIASGIGRRIPIYGGKDSRTEIALIGLSDRVIAALEFFTKDTRSRVERVAHSEASESKFVLGVIAEESAP